MEQYQYIFIALAAMQLQAFMGLLVVHAIEDDLEQPIVLLARLTVATCVGLLFMAMFYASGETPLMLLPALAGIAAGWGFESRCFRDPLHA